MTLRKLFFALWALVLATAAQAHEPYLLLTAKAGGTFLAEAGFSDAASVEGMKLLVRNRESGETLSEHALPADGKLTLPAPAMAYRVTFDGGPGHRISKPGPDPVGPAPASAPAAVAAAESAAKAGPPAVTALAVAAPPAAAKPLAAVAPPPAPVSGASDMVRIALVVGIFFLFGAIAFALGYGAGRRGS